MDLLKNKIISDGRALPGDVLLVDSFLNHQIDVPLMREIGREFARIYQDMGITRIVTIESSGIAPAFAAAEEMGLPLVVMKKSVSSLLTEGILQTPVFSYTKGSTYHLTLKRRFINEGDRVLFIDDFLANGEAALGAAKLIEGAGAELSGIGIVIEKAYQSGRKKLLDAGYDVVALASVAAMDEGVIEFVK